MVICSAQARTRLAPQIAEILRLLRLTRPSSCRPHSCSIVVARCPVTGALGRSRACCDQHLAPSLSFRLQRSACHFAAMAAPRATARFAGRGRRRSECAVRLRRRLQATAPAQPSWPLLLAAPHRRCLAQRAARVAFPPKGPAQRRSARVAPPTASRLTISHPPGAVARRKDERPPADAPVGLRFARRPAAAARPAGLPLSDGCVAGARARLADRHAGVAAVAAQPAQPAEPAQVAQLGAAQAGNPRRGRAVRALLSLRHSLPRKLVHSSQNSRRLTRLLSLQGARPRLRPPHLLRAHRCCSRDRLWRRVRRGSQSARILRSLFRPLPLLGLLL